MVDLFFFRDPDAEEEEEVETAPAAPLNWEQPQAQNWGDAAPEGAAVAADAAPAAPEGVAQPPAGQQWDSGLSNVASAWQQE